MHFCEHPTALQARVAKHIAAEAEWLRLLCEELQPVMAHLQENSPSRSAPKLSFMRLSLQACSTELTLRSGPCGAGLQASLQAVADRALQVGEAAIASYRAHRSSRAENAAILRQAVRIPRTVAPDAQSAPGQSRQPCAC